MTRSTHLRSPEPAEVRALLEAAGLSCYAAAKLPIGATARQLQRAVSGATDDRTKAPYRLSGAVWLLLNLTLRQSAREALPPAVLT